MITALMVLMTASALYAWRRTGQALAAVAVVFLFMLAAFVAGLIP